MFDIVATPEHLHAMLNHLPLVGAAAAAVVFLYGLAAQSRGAILAGFWLCVVFGGSTGAVMHYGEEAQLRFEAGEVQPPLDSAGVQWLQKHAEDAHLASRLGYALAAFGLIGLLLSVISKATVPFMGLIGLFLSIACVGFMAWAALSGGKIRHPEFRGEEQKPEVSLQAPAC